ncbi:MAG: chain-length determining protein [Deltaproteobacteria bacterium GWA2_54_12]|nr:MAG: chain-length determining protein [Deltaproteobacteria bacterium GWA2_54_12]
MKQQKIIKIEDAIKIIRRRRLGFIVPALTAALLSVLVLLVWKPVYRSTSTILIEEQEISRDYVMATVTSYAEQRLQTINQRIMSGARLLEIINRFNLYEDKRNKLTTEEIIEDMRKKHIRFETITADVIDRRTGRPTAATIAFTVSYEGENPLVVQQVANVLASLYLEENIKVVGQQTAGTTKFLEEEMKSVQANLAELERKITVYKEKNPRALPELLQFNLQALDWSDRNYDQLNDQLRTLREKESYLQTELATIAPDTTNQDRERLKELRVMLVSLMTRYSDEYPDVIKTKAEIVELKRKLQSPGSQPAVAEKPDNPAYVALAAQLASVQTEIKSAQRQVEDIDKKRNDYRRRLEMSPRVEEGYKNLMVERNNTQAKYDDLMKKFMEARVAHGLEKEQMGERFTLIDPARLPEKPVRPNRPAVLLIGLIFGIGAGAGTALLQEATDSSARRSEDLTTAFPFPVLAEIPEIVTLEDELRRRKRLKTITGITVLLLVILVPVIHFFVIDLDVLWARVARRLAW